MNKIDYNSKSENCFSWSKHLVRFLFYTRVSKVIFPINTWNMIVSVHVGTQRKGQFKRKWITLFYIQHRKKFIKLCWYIHIELVLFHTVISMNRVNEVFLLPSGIKSRVWIFFDKKLHRMRAKDAPINLNMFLNF